MSQERRSVESPQTNAIRLPAISLPVAERQGYHQVNDGTRMPTRPPQLNCEEPAALMLIECRPRKLATSH